MSETAAPATAELLKLISDDLRWRLILAMRAGDLQVGELATQIGSPQSLISYHLGVLRQAGLVQVHRSDADARTTYYGLNLAAFVSLYTQIGQVWQIPPELLPVVHDLALPTPPPQVIFLCTANSARSQIAEAWLRQLSAGRVVARSAGTKPRTLHPHTVAVMAEVGIDIGYQSAKGYEALREMKPDMVVSVCDIAREECAYWGSEVRHIHWSIPDPVAVPGDLATQLAAFRRVRDQLRSRVAGLLPVLAQQR
ncbi:MAG: metalloregulator ArsR/SmtB family transcription factor [Roseiflexaceae bacterium]